MKVLKFIGYLLCYLFYPLSFLMPRTKKILVFGSFKGAFNDNAKYLFLYANTHPSHGRPVWISTNRKTVQYIRQHGFESYWVVSPCGIWYALRGKYWFVNAYLGMLILSPFLNRLMYLSSCHPIKNAFFFPVDLKKK